MVWGCMGWNGVARLSEIEERIDSAQYVDILDQHLSQSIEDLEIPAAEAISSMIMIQSTPPRWHKNGFLKIRLRY